MALRQKMPNGLHGSQLPVPAGSVTRTFRPSLRRCRNRSFNDAYSPSRISHGTASVTIPGHDSRRQVSAAVVAAKTTHSRPFGAKLLPPNFRHLFISVKLQFDIA